MGTEVRGGLVTFVTISYILILNPIILGGEAAADINGTALDPAAVASSTALAAALLTILFGLVANLPFALAAGLGINSFLAVNLVAEVTWPEAMGRLKRSTVVSRIWEAPRWDPGISATTWCWVLLNTGGFRPLLHSHMR